MVPALSQYKNKVLPIASRFKHRYFRFIVSRTPRYITATTRLLGNSIEFVDSASFLYIVEETFWREIFKYSSLVKEPLIIDAGANIGLCTIYFKRLYPNSRVIAFEPDPRVFNTLQKNIRQFGLEKIELVNKAIWYEETTLPFMAEGADGGRIVDTGLEYEKFQVQTTRLRKYLTKEVDFLKLDIEGAELEVIKDCQDLLFNVRNLFVEYHSFVGQPQYLHILLDILAKAGFRFHIHSPNASARPFYQRNISLNMDLQLNIFAFRELGSKLSPNE